MIERTVEVGGFKYTINIHPKSNGVNFDIVDTVTMAGSIEKDIIASGYIDFQGRLKIKDIYCDVHAAMALGDILKAVYENSYKFMN